MPTPADKGTTPPRRTPESPREWLETTCLSPFHWTVKPHKPDKVVEMKLPSYRCCCAIDNPHRNMPEHGFQETSCGKNSPPKNPVFPRNTFSPSRKILEKPQNHRVNPVVKIRPHAKNAEKQGLRCSPKNKERQKFELAREKRNHCLIPSTQHSAPSTQHSALSTQHSVLGTRYSVLGIHYPNPHQNVHF